ncbi:MAG: hypothetical protein JXJ04_20325 [Spirochaetales bacterium]|nr:hypothetical protein [Spirochaetales bacterium]
MKRHIFKIFLYCICITVLLIFAGCGKQAAPKQSPVPQAEIVPGSGNVMVKPETITTKVNEEFTTEIIIDSGNQKVAAYGFLITFNKNIIDVDVAKGNSGVEPGKDGYVAAQNANNPGKLDVAGFDVYGKGPGKELHFLTIHWKAVRTGKSTIDIKVKNLVDETTKVIGRPAGINSEVTVE